jgi:antitoxin CptB
VEQVTEDDRQARLGRLRWHCRRALLELDLVFQRFWESQGEALTARDEIVLARLLALEDHDLWALVSGRTRTEDPALAAMVARLRLLSA